MRTWKWWLVGVLWLLISACSRADNALTYTGPTEVTVKAGAFVPGTPIQFLGVQDGKAEVSIEGQRVTRLLGDSLTWEGEITTNVRLRVNLRVLHIAPERLITGGTVTITVREPQPRAAEVDTQRPVRYTIPVTYKVNVGETIPGTTIRYAGPSEKGARLEGLEGYPYRAIGDSILWDGRLQDNVDLQLNVRVIFYNRDFLQVLGTATVGITP